MDLDNDWNEKDQMEYEFRFSKNGIVNPSKIKGGSIFLDLDNNWNEKDQMEFRFCKDGIVDPLEIREDRYFWI